MNLKECFKKMQMIFVKSSSTDEYLTKDKIYSGMQRSIGLLQLGSRDHIFPREFLYYGL